MLVSVTFINNDFVRREFFQKIIIIEGSKSHGGDITPNIFLADTPAGAESDLNAAAATPSQTEVTDLNCSDHSTTSKEMARGELW